MGRPKKIAQIQEKTKPTSPQSSSRRLSENPLEKSSPSSVGLVDSEESIAVSELQAEVKRLRSLMESFKKKEALSKYAVAVQNPHGPYPVEQSEETAAVRAEYRQSNRHPMVKDGMNLAFVSPRISNGVPRAIVDKDEVRHLKLKWKATCVMYVVGCQPNIATFSKFLKSCWPHLDNLMPILHQDGYYLVQCLSEEVAVELVNRGNVMMGKRPVLVRMWDAQFDFTKDILRVIPVWIRLIKLPTKFWGMNSLSRIGSLFGVPLAAHSYTAYRSRVNYARILVEVDVTKPLPKSIFVEDEDGNVYDQAFFIEWIPAYCQKCHEVGHSCEIRKPVKSSTQAPLAKDPGLISKGQEIVQPIADLVIPPEEEGEWVSVVKRRSSRIRGTLEENNKGNLEENNKGVGIHVNPI